MTRARFLLIALVAAAMVFTMDAPRVLAADQAAKNRFTQAEQVRKQKLDEYQTVKRLLQAAQQRAKKDKSQAAKKALQEQARQFLMTTLDAMQAQLDAVSNKLQAVSGIDEQTQTTISGELVLESAWLHQTRTAVTAASAAGLAQQAHLIRDHWNAIRSTVKRTLGEIRKAKLSTLLTQTHTMGTQLQTRVTILETTKVDTGALPSLMAQYRQHAAAVEQQLRDVQSQLQSIRNVPDSASRFRIAASLMDAAEANLREAAKTLTTALEALQTFAQRKSK